MRSRQIIHGGRKDVRQATYIAAFVAIRSDPTLKKFYQRLLADSKLKKLALTTPVRKLLIHLKASMKLYLIDQN